MKPHISIITLGVKNLERSTKFYEDLGFPVERSEDITFIKTSKVTRMALYSLENLAY